MEDKKAYIKNLAEEAWDCGHPFGSDDFRYFQRCCADDGYDMTQEDWNYYWECFNDCKAAQFDAEEQDIANGYYGDNDYSEDDPMNCKLAPWYRKQLMGEEAWNEYIKDHNPEDEYLKANPYIEYMDGKPNPYYKGLHESYDEDEFWDEEYERTHPEFYDPYDGINDDELLVEASGSARYNYAGKSSSGGNTAIGVVGHRDLRDFGASNLDFFGEHFLDEIKANLESMTYTTTSGKTKLAINMNLTDISIDKDPAPGETVKERRIRGYIYFNTNFDNIKEDRQVLKQKVLQAFQNGKADFNDKYKKDYLVVKDLIHNPKSFKYSNDNKSMYFVFTAFEEHFKGDKAEIIIHKRAKESHALYKCPICHEDVWTDEGRVPVMINGKKEEVHEYHCTDESLENYYDYCEKFWATHDSSGWGRYAAMQAFKPPLCQLKGNTREIFESIIKNEIPF